ncbi:MAG TPA: hypothetical protein VNO70_01145, partial [Blastocatellia bacterium]|nr:hypothetical protein [Blastocatellia bacterium]
NWEEIPAQLLTERPVRVCLKCGFDIMTKQLGLAPRTAYSEMKKFVPEATAFRSEPQRPLFWSEEARVPCPYCNAAKRWVATVRGVEIAAHQDIAKLTKKLLADVKKKPDQFTIVKDTRSPVQVFADWLERLSQQLDFTDETWLREAAIEYLRRREPLADWTDIENVERIFLSRPLEEGWERNGNRLYLSPVLYGDVLVTQYMLGRTHLHGALTFEGRLTPFEFFHRLRRLGYLEKRGIEADDPSSALEGAIARLAAEGDIKPIFIIDRSEYLDQLKAIYDKMKG